MKNGVVILPRNWVVILNWNQVLTLNWNWVVNITGICIKQNNYSKTENLLKQNTGLEPSRFEPLANLLFFYKMTNNNPRTIETAEKIINLPVKIRSKKVLEYKELAKKYTKIKE